MRSCRNAPLVEQIRNGVSRNWPHSADLCRFWTDFDLTRPRLPQFCPNLPDLARCLLAKPDPHLTRFGRIGANIGKFRSMLADLGQLLAGIRPKSTE